MPSRYLTIFLSTIIQFSVFGQNLYLENYTQKEYALPNYTTSPQNWDMEQDSLGRLYIANSTGVLLFDGLTWTMIQGTENKNLRYLAKTSDGVIFAGGLNELGQFLVDSLGRTVFISILPKLEEQGIKTGEMEQLLTSETSLFVTNETGLIVIEGEKAMFHQMQSKPGGMVLADDRLLIQDDNGNILKMDENEFSTLFSFGSALNSGIVAIVDLSEKEKLLFTTSLGIFQITNGKLKKWSSVVDSFLPDTEIKEVINYTTLGIFAIATKGMGIQFMNYDGDRVKSLGIEQGLTSNTCYSLFRNDNNELWVCMDVGIARIEYPSALSYFDNSNGLDGIVYCAIEFESQVYVGTTSGLYYLGADDQFIKMAVANEVWDLKMINTTVWVASTSGLYILDGTKVQLVNAIDSRTIAPSSNSNKIWVGLPDGIGSMERHNGEWEWRGKIEGVDHEVRTIAVKDSVLWGSYEKVSRIVLDEDKLIPKSFKTLDEKNGYSEDLFVVESYHIRDKVYFGTVNGLFSYDLTQEKLVSAQSFGTRFSDKEHYAWALAEDDEHNVWVNSNGISGKLVFENNQVQSWDTLALARLQATDVWRIIPTKGKPNVYFCTTDGLFILNRQIEKNYEIDYATIINKIALKGDSVISYLAIDQSKGTAKVQIPFSHNDLRFGFTATTFNYDEEIKFSYMLEGYDEDWSSWKTESFKDYTNLPFGNYSFKVKAKNLYGIEAKAAQYSFSIMRPWYHTYWAYGIGLILLSGILFVIDRYQRKRLFKKQQKRIELQQQRLERERQISNKLRKVDRLKDEFLANTSHELRTPLNGIIGISESLYEESGKIDAEELKSNLAMVIASGKRLSSLVDSILDYSKLKTQDLEIRKRPIDLRSIVKMVLTMSRPLISRENLNLVNDIPENLPPVYADENRLQQILYNLVGNAIKFTERGKIAVGASLKDERVEIIVSDEGVGIAPEMREKIFDSYEQISNQVSREYIGTGLGLAITKKLVELHNGTIRVESEQGEGSKFIFTIPVSHQESPITETQEAVQIDEGNLEIEIKEPTKTLFSILIVDDEPINRQVIINHLKNESYHLDVASGGAEALELIEKRKFDMVLLDVMMPKMSGFEVCMKIRERYMMSELPVIFITAKGQVVDLVEGLKYGGNDYITKPFSKEEFLARVKTHLNLININDSYSRFIPYEFLQSLGRESIMEVNLGDQIEKEVTILFSDIRDYTTLSERMTPKENFNFLNSFLNKMGPVIRENGGFVMQYLGDGLMSLFLHKPMDAVRASIEMAAQIEKYNLARESKSRFAISVGFGLHTGKLVMGVIGDEKRMDVNVVSDSVNTASRMEGLTKHYGASIIMSEDTLQGLVESEELNYRFLGLVKVKGKSKPLKIYEILDGITDDANKWKIETREQFEAGLEFYFNKDFINAATQFKQVTTKNQSDVAAQMYLELAAKYMVENVPENWTGVETMLLK